MSRQRAAKAQKRMQVENTINFNQAPRTAPRQVHIVPRTRNQERLVLALRDQNAHIIVTVGPAGTGKTYLAMQAAVRALREGECERIVITRPAVGVEGEQHGFLPGNLVAKMEPWTRPLLDVMREYYRAQDIVTLIEDQVIDIAPLSMMRGRTFKNSWIIADEMQNATPAQAKMLLTRIGTNSKIIMTGDVEQTDIKHSSNALVDLCERLQKGGGIEGLVVCPFENRDIQRHPIIGKILEIYKD